MKSTDILPDGYEKIFTLDLQKDRRLALWVNLLAALIAVAMVIVAAFFVPLKIEINSSKPLGSVMGLLAVAGGMILYIVLHEAVHGIFMRYYGTTKPFFGFTGLYAYAGSKDYFAKRPYIIIALAPIVLLGLALISLNILLPAEWFWAVYLIQVINVSGAAGDLYVTCKLLRMPGDILVVDAGVSMQVFSASDKKRDGA